MRSSKGAFDNRKPRVTSARRRQVPIYFEKMVDCRVVTGNNEIRRHLQDSIGQRLDGPKRRIPMYPKRRSQVLHWIAAPTNGFNFPAKFPERHRDACRRGPTKCRCD